MRIEWQIKVEDTRFLVVKVEGEKWKAVYKSLFRRDLKQLRKCTSYDELCCLFKKLEEKAALKEAFRLLAMRDHFPKELFNKLLEKKLSEDAIECAIDKCFSMGYLDEKALMTRYEQALKRKGKGPRYIATKLKERCGHTKYITRDLVSEREEIRALLEKRFSQKDASEKEKQRAIRFLLSRGHDLQQIYQVIHE